MRIPNLKGKGGLLLISFFMIFVIIGSVEAVSIGVNKENVADRKGNVSVFVQSFKNTDLLALYMTEGASLKLLYPSIVVQMVHTGPIGNDSYRIEILDLLSPTGFRVLDSGSLVDGYGRTDFKVITRSIDHLRVTVGNESFNYRGIEIFAGTSETSIGETIEEETVRLSFVEVKMNQAFGLGFLGFLGSLGFWFLYVKYRKNRKVVVL